jgi:N6-adenosine-specific RNA methylase IME4
MRLFNWPFGELEPNSFDFMMADPPWRQKMYSEKGLHRSPDRHYKTMPLADIQALPVLDLAKKDCVLWLWAINPMLPQAIETLERWGFTFKTSGAWIKTTERGKITFGTGYILRGCSEPFLIGTRGKPKTTRSVRGAFLGLRRDHSEKPEEAFKSAERLMPNADRLELFSRTDRPGWQHWGDETNTISREEAAA